MSVGGRGGAGMWGGFIYLFFYLTKTWYGLLTKCEVKMAGYLPSSFLRVYGPRRSRDP